MTLKMEQSLIVVIEQNIQMMEFLDLEHWKQNSTKDNIFSRYFIAVILATSRRLREWQHCCNLHSKGTRKIRFGIYSFNNIYYDYIYSQVLKEMALLMIGIKNAQLRHFWCFKQFRKLPKRFYDDKIENLKDKFEKWEMSIALMLCSWNGRFAY